MRTIAEIDDEHFLAEHPRDAMAPFTHGPDWDWSQWAERAIEADLAKNLLDGGSVQGWRYTLLAEPYSVINLQAAYAQMVEPLDDEALEALIPHAQDFQMFGPELIPDWKRATVLGVWSDCDVSGMIVAMPEDPRRVVVLFC